MQIPMTAHAARSLGGVGLIALGLILFRLGAPHDDAWFLVTLGAAVLDPRRPISGLSALLSKAKDLKTMSEAPDQTISTAGADANAGGASQTPTPAPAAPTVSVPGVNPAHTAIIQLAQAQAAPTEDWATRAAEAISDADPLIQAGEQLGRASGKTQAYIALGELAIPALARILQRFFPHPATQGA